jgi:hypothetical protein
MCGPLRQSSEQQQQQQTRLTRPPDSWYKCWLVLQRFIGSFCIGRSSWLQGKFSIIEGEAIALMVTMKEVKRRGFANVIFETDSKSVVDVTHCLHTGVSEFSSLICKIKNMLSLSTNLEVKFIKQQVNMVAHKLARAAISWSSRNVLETMPTGIEPLVLKDMI